MQNLRFVLLYFLFYCGPALPLFSSSALALPASPLNTYWVDPGGSDANPCSETQPCQTINYVLSTLAASGDVIKLLPGVYREQLNITLDNITMEGIGAGVQIYGAAVPDLVEAEGKYVANWSWGESYQGTNFCNNLTSDLAMDTRECNTLGFWQGEERLHQVFAKADVVAGTFYYDFTGEQVWLLPVSGNNNLDEVEGLTHAYVVRLAAESQGVTLRNIDVWYGASMPDEGILQIEGSGHVLVDVDVRYSAGAGVRVFGADQVYMENVTASHHGQNGWRVSADASFSTSTGWSINDWVDGLQVFTSSSRNNGWKGFDNCWGGGGTKFSFTRDLVIDEFYSADNNGFGIWLDIENHEYVIQESMSARDTGRGVFVEYISDNGVVENNVVYGTKDADAIGCGISIGLAAADSRHVVLKNNTVYATEPDVKGMMLKTGCSTCRSFPYPSENVTWENNLLVNKDDAGFVRDLDAGTNDTFSYFNTVIEEEYAGDSSVLVCWDSFGGCSTDQLGINTLPPGNYLADASSECGFQPESDLVIGVGAQGFQHPRGTEVCAATIQALPPVAAFTFTVNELQVILNDESTDDSQVVAWAWDFGDGNTSTSQNPVHTYASAGAFTVSLTVTDDEGLTDTVSGEVVVSESDPPTPPVAGFTYTMSDLVVTFTDTSTDDESIVSWDWQFGDGNASAGQNPVHAYASAGVYEVSLTVTDSDGLTADVTQLVDLPDISPPPVDVPPVANFSFAIDAFEVSFTDLSTDADGIIQNWLWDFGDGNTSSQQHPTHLYATAGQYTVMLEVTDDDGLIASSNMVVELVDPPLVEEGAFIEEDGIVVMEAEHFAVQFANVATSDTWVEVNDDDEGESVIAMQALEDNGDLILSNYTMDNAELQFQVLLTSTGTYYVWLRLWALEDGHSVYVGCDEQTTRIGVSVQEVPSAAWTWHGERNPDRPAVFSVSEPGEKTFSIWMREDGLSIDRIILTTDPNFVPEGIGPAESPRTGASLAKVSGHDNGVYNDVLLFDQSVNPAQFATYPIFPNPATGTAVLEMDLPENVLIEGGVYSVQGRRVKKIEAQTLAAGTRRRLHIDVSALGPGVYLYKIHVLQGGQVQLLTGKVVVVSS